MFQSPFLVYFGISKFKKLDGDAFFGKNVESWKKVIEKIRFCWPNRESSEFFQITNMGPSSIASAKVQLLWPLSLESGDLLFGLDDVVTVGPVTCDAAHVIDQTKTLVQKLPPPQSKYVSDDSYTEVNYYVSKHSC